MKQQALEALDSMDDFARMADIDAIGPRKVLEDFISNSYTADQLRQAKVEALREAADKFDKKAGCANAVGGCSTLSAIDLRRMAQDLEGGKK